MANYNQKSGVFVADIPFKNYGVSDIAAGLAVLADTANTDGVVLPTGGAGVAGTIGVTVETIAAGAYGRVRVYGVAVGTADGAVTVGNFVQASDTGGKVGRIKAIGAATEQLGKALDTAGDGDPIRVLLFAAKNA